MYSSDLDMVVSVKKSHAVSTLCRENRSGFIESYFNRDLLPRQAFDSFYEYTGSIYVINVNSLISKTMGKFINVKKIIINELESIDIDNQYDWILAESIVKSEIR
jgi:N-acylneuraminate cytidylyltransferase